MICRRSRPTPRGWSWSRTPSCCILRTLEDMELPAATAPEGVPALGYQWDVGDGTTAEDAGVRHTYTHPGAFSVCLRVDGVDGLAEAKEFSIKVSGPLRTRFTLEQNRRYVDPTGP